MDEQQIKTCIGTNFNSQTRHAAEGFLKVVSDLKLFLPLTVRQIFYQLVAGLVVGNNIGEYHKVSRIGTKLRILELVPWDAIEDRTRRTTEKRGLDNLQAFLREQIEVFCNPQYYKRCYIQEQAIYCEVTTEKDALSRIIEEETYWFCTRLNIIRGQVSTTMTEQIATRLDKAIMKGQKPVILHFGDLDPSGIAIPKALQRNILERHNIDVEVKTIALTIDQVEKYNLPLSVDAIKPKDPNYGAWLEKYGRYQSPVELDALHPDIIQKIIREALSSVYDMDQYETQKNKELKERNTLKIIRNDVQTYLYGAYPEYFHC